MKVKLLNIVNSKNAITKLGEKTSYDAKTAYRIARNIKEIISELENFEKAKGELFKKYGEKDGDDIKIKKENTDVFNKELSDILDIDVELDIIMINPEKLSGSSPFELLAVEWMLELE